MPSKSNHRMTSIWKSVIQSSHSEEPSVTQHYRLHKKRLTVNAKFFRWQFTRTQESITDACYQNQSPSKKRRTNQHYCVRDNIRKRVQRWLFMAGSWNRFFSSPQCNACRLLYHRGENVKTKGYNRSMPSTVTVWRRKLHTLWVTW